MENSPEGFDKENNETEKNIIDSSAEPKIPFEGWSVLENNTEAGKIEWDKVKTAYVSVSTSQLDKYSNLGEGLIPLNANVLNYFIEHQEDIPDRWRKYFSHNDDMPFCGTVYKNENGRKRVPALHRNAAHPGQEVYFSINYMMNAGMPQRSLMQESAHKQGYGTGDLHAPGPEKTLECPVIVVDQNREDE